MKKKLLKIFVLAFCACVAATGLVACGDKPVDPSKLNGGKSLNYVLLDDDTYGVTIGECYAVPEVTIPATYEGKKVTTVMENFFEYNEVVGQDEKGQDVKRKQTDMATYSLIISEGITTIQGGAFSDCKLKRVELPSTLSVFGKNIGGWNNSICEICNNTAFPIESGWDDAQKEYGYIASDAINIYTPSQGQRRINMDENGVITYTDNGVITYTDADGKKALVDYCGMDSVWTIPADIDYVYKYGCRYNGVIKEITIPATCKTFEEYAFSNCDKLEIINIADGVEKIVQGFCFNDSFLYANVPQSLTNFSGFGNCKSNGTICYYYEESEFSAHKWELPSGSNSTAERLFGIRSVERTADGLVYAVKDDEAYLIKYVGNGVTGIVIADNYAGKPVTKICKQAFYKSEIKDIKIGNNVTEICRDAFGYCKELYEVVIPDSVTGIAECAFDHCLNLTKLTLGTNLENTLYTSGMPAFQSCYRLCDVYNRSAHSEAVKGLPSGIENIYTEEGGSKITVENGLVIYTDGETVKVVNYIGESDEVVIPDNVTEIRAYAFEYKNVKKVAIGNGVKKILNSAFVGCSELVEVVIPESVETIGDLAFMCDNLKEITYLGTVSQWNAIEKGSKYTSYPWHSNALEKVICTDGEKTI